jgi:hypothetical protein
MATLVDELVPDQLWAMVEPRPGRSLTRPLRSPIDGCVAPAAPDPLTRTLGPDLPTFPATIPTHQLMKSRG